MENFISQALNPSTLISLISLAVVIWKLRKDSLREAVREALIEHSLECQKETLGPLEARVARIEGRLNGR